MQDDQRDQDSGTAQLLREGKALRALARKLLASPTDAEDVVQDATAAALAAPTAARQRLGPWLSGTVRNLASMLRRTEARRRTRQQLASRPEVDADSDPAAIAMHAELMQDVATAVRQLEEPFRSVIVLRFWRGLPPEQIAAELAVPRNTVRSRLQRGLERLRARLDRKYGERQRWSAPLAAMPGIREMAVATGGGILVLFVGMMMQTKLLLGAAAVLLVAVAVPWSLAGASLEPVPPAATAGARPAVAEILPMLPERREIAAAAPTVEPVAAAASAAVAPWPARFLVTDDDDMPVAGATISIWTGPDLPKEGGALTHAKEPMLQVQTDAEGRARAMLHRAWVAVAAQRGDCRTGDTWLCNAHDADKETVFVLQVPILQHGTVLKADGSPAVGAIVHVNVQGWSGRQRGAVPEPRPVTVDTAGRFVMPLQLYGIYAIDAELAGARTFRDGFEVNSDPPADLLLTFPGAITIGGVVVDLAGAPVAGADVHAWREYDLADPAQDPDDMETAQDKTGPDGRFAFEVRQFRRYQLIASAPGRANSDVLWVEPTNVRAHPEVRLSLRTDATIRGVVLTADGSPIAEALVTTTAEAGTPLRANAVPSRQAMFGDPATATTAVDGSFALAVHPGTTWKVEVFPVRGASMLSYCQRGVRADAAPVEFRLSEAQLRGAVVRGEVVRADDGKPVEHFELRVLPLDDADAERMSWTDSGSSLRLPILPLGCSYAFVITPRPAGERQGEDPELAPVRVGPFTTSVVDREFQVQVPRWASLPLQILDADGAPVRGAEANLLQPEHVHMSFKANHTDRDGRLRLERNVPGTGRLMVWRRMQKLLEQDVTLVSGPNPELVIHLPPR